MKKYLISGIPPSHGGVGYLMYYLDELASHHDYKSIYTIHLNKSIRNNIFNPLFIFKELIKRYISKKDFIRKLNQITNSEVILIHPQSIGYNQFLKLINKNLKIKIYVMDNSFFCIKSYNVLDNKECLKCINDFDKCASGCMPFPFNYHKDDNLNYLEQYKKISSRISFYAQNESQAKLLKNHFGENTKVQVIGMKTSEVFKGIQINKNTKKYDIVFHGGDLEAKGINYFIELAKILPSYSFFIPVKLGTQDLLENITCDNITWNNGLKDIVINAKLVMNPSLWSAPVEGALLKSIYYNGNVAVVKTEFGFINDIPDNILLKLSDDIFIAKIAIEDFFKNKIDLKSNSRNWLNNYLDNECTIDKLFENINND